MKRNKQIDISRALALAGAFNFLRCCARACLLPFLTLYLRQLGLTAAMTGIIMGTKHLITLTWSPVASLLSKHYNKRREAIIGSLVCSAAVALALLLVPPTDGQTQSGACNVSDLSGGGVGPATTRPDLRNDTAADSQAGGTVPETPPETRPAPAAVSKPSLHELDKSSPQLSEQVVDSHGGPERVPDPAAAPVRNRRSKLGGKQSEEKTAGGAYDFLSSLNSLDAQHQVFFLILFTVSVWESAAAPLEWTADDGLYEYLDYADASDRYSSTRLWDLLGAACGVGGAGLLVSHLSCAVAGQTRRTAVHFYCYAGAAALALPVAVYLPLRLNKKRDRASGLLKAMQLVRDSPRALLCAVTTLLVGVAGSTVDNFLLWQMQDHGSNEMHMGLSLALALLSQAAFPLLVGQLSKLLSPGRALTVGAATLGLQCVYYSFLWAPWAALPAQVLSCFSSGALWWAITLQCEDVATPGADQSVRRVYASLAVHLGSGLGSFAGGLVAQRFGLAWLFRGAAVGLFLWCVCLLLLQWKAPRERRINYSRLLAADASEASDSESDQERDWLDKAMEDDRSNNNYGRRPNH